MELPALAWRAAKLGYDNLLPFKDKQCSSLMNVCGYLRRKEVNMIIRSATFEASFTEEKSCPANGRSEFAFIGRSNVGKSSLINMLCFRTSLVKVSNTPGKTRLLNFFLINEEFYFVDLPGYGFAQVSRSERRKWEVMIREYMTNRKSLQCVFLLIDSRLGPQKLDLDFANQLAVWKVPFVIAFTKSDKQGGKETQHNVQLFLHEMKKHWETLPQYFITSSTKKIGRKELLDFISQYVTQPEGRDDEMMDE